MISTGGPEVALPVKNFQTLLPRHNFTFFISDFERPRQIKTQNFVHVNDLMKK
jgi:hypothetical protein